MTKEAPFSFYIGLAVMLAGIFAFTGSTSAHDGEHHGEVSGETRVEVQGSVGSDKSASSLDRSEETDARNDDTIDNAPEEKERGTESDADGDGYGDASVRSGAGSDERVPVGVNGEASGRVEIEEGMEADTSRRSVGKKIDKATPKLMERLSIDASSPVLYEGVSVTVAGDVCATEDADCDDGGSDVHPGRAYGVRVSGAVVRGWDPEKKQEIRARLSAINEINTANDFGVWVAGQALENEAIVNVATDETQTEVRYKTRLRFLGFIPMNTEVTARAEADGNVEVDYPWYAFLARKGDQSVFTRLAADIRSSHDSVMVASEAEVTVAD